MSIIGIDVGTTAVKTAVYTEDGRMITYFKEPVKHGRYSGGLEETCPEDVLNAVLAGLRQITAHPEVVNDPSIALAISASGDEVFPVNENGEAIGVCILSGDTRGEDIENRVSKLYKEDEWYSICGHVPERMDPVNRILWWKENKPDIYSRAAGFWGWHEYLTAYFTGKAVTDKTLAAKWLVYDIEKNDWSDQMLEKFSIDRQLLPDIGDWGTPVGVIKPEISNKTGLAHDIVVGVGSYDATCSSLGAGAYRSGLLGLSCGTWESVVAPMDTFAVGEKIIDYLFPIIPYAGKCQFAVLSQSPNGAVVADWSTRLLNVSFDELPHKLDLSGLEPSPVMAVPHLSGAVNPWKDGRDSRGALLGITLATSREDIIKALLEGVAYDLAIATGLLQDLNIKAEVIRATGGGTKSSWWMQLKSDLTEIPIEISGEREPGCLGAALLAGTAAGIFSSVHEACEAVKSTTRRFEPNLKRQRLHAERMDHYQEAVKTLITLNRGILNG